MKNTLINTIILSSTVICAAQNPPTPPPQPVKPVFYGLPRFDESPTNGPAWNFNDNANNNPAMAFYFDRLEYATAAGPSLKSPYLGPLDFARLSINPPERLQGGTNIFHNLTFYYRWYNIGWTDAGIRVNGVFSPLLPSFEWVKFSTNINYGVVHTLSFEISNPLHNRTFLSTFQIDAVQWHPLYTFPENNSTNFVVLTTGLKSNIKWNANVYPAGRQGFKLYGSTNMVNFSLITNTPVLTNGFFTVSLTKGNNEFYQLQAP
jgi:hypothetical protein